MNKNSSQLGFNFEDPEVIETVEEKKRKEFEAKEAEKILSKKREELKTKLQELVVFDFKKLDEENIEDDNQLDAESDEVDEDE